MAITVKMLYEFCNEQIKQGNGDKTVLISKDDEGNEYHPLYYEFLSDTKEIEDLIEIDIVPNGTNPNEVVLLG